MKYITIKQNNNAELFRKLESIGCERTRMTVGGRNNNERNTGGTPGRQGRNTYRYANYMHDRVVNANLTLCAEPKTTQFNAQNQ